MRRFTKLMAITTLLFAAVSGAKADFDVISFGDVRFTGGSLHFHAPTYVGGNVTAGGNIPDFGLDNVYYPDGYSLVVAGDYARTDGNINNNTKVLYGGSSSATGNSDYTSKFVKDTTGKIASYGINKQDYLDLSNAYAGMDAISAITSVSNIAIQLTSDVITTQVYTMTESVFEAQNTTLSFSGYDPDDSIVINVSGTEIYMSNSNNYSFNGDSEFYSRVTWNFYEAESVNLKEFYGNVLAPNADYIQRNGNLFGKLVANTISGDGQIHPGGDFPEIPAVPAPSAVVLAGLGVATAARRRFQR